MVGDCVCSRDCDDIKGARAERLTIIFRVVGEQFTSFAHFIIFLTIIPRRKDSQKGQHDAQDAQDAPSCPADRLADKLGDCQAAFVFSCSCFKLLLFLKIIHL